MSPSRLCDETWLRQRVAAHHNLTEIAAAAGVTVRAVRYALARHGIKPATRLELAELAVAEYQAGTPVADIARLAHRSESWIHKTLRKAGVERPEEYRQRANLYPHSATANG